MIAMVPTADTQTRNQGGFANNFWVQTAALVIIVAALVESRQASGSSPRHASSSTAARNRTKRGSCSQRPQYPHAIFGHFARRKDWIPSANRALVWLSSTRRHCLSLPKTIFERIDGVGRPESDRRQCPRTARSDVYRACPSQAKRGFAPHYNSSRISQGFAEGGQH
jgi:hypothetical protein